MSWSRARSAVMLKECRPSTVNSGLSARPPTTRTLNPANSLAASALSAGCSFSSTVTITLSEIICRSACFEAGSVDADRLDLLHTERQQKSLCQTSYWGEGQEN